MTEHNPDLDLSVLAKARGGGGHKQACGFECTWDEMGAILGIQTKTSQERQVGEPTNPEQAISCAGSEVNGKLPQPLRPTSTVVLNESGG